MAAKTTETELAIATREYTKARDHLASLQATVESLQLALSVESHQRREHTKPKLVDPVAAKIDQAHMSLADRRPEQAEKLLRDTLDAIAEAGPVLSRAGERLNLARRRETSQIAQALQPRQRAAVVKIRKCLEALGEAIAEEGEVRAELKRRAPESESGYLPDMTAELAFADLSVWSSPASLWLKRMKKTGVL